MQTKALSLIVIPFLLLAIGCNDNGTSAQALTSVSGRVVAGPVAGANVSVRPLLNTGALGASLGSGTTDSEGYYSFHVFTHDGPAVVIAQGGSYVDEATGNTIVANDLEMGSLVVLDGLEDKTAHVTVATTIAARRAAQLATSPTIDALDALENGVAMVEEYYGITGILTTLPADLTAGAVEPGVAAEYGALNAGFSQLAADQGIFLSSLIAQLALDASDGMFDGHYFAGPLYVEGPSGESDLVVAAGGSDLRDSIESFVGDTTRNQSGLTIDNLSVDQAIDDHVTPDEYAYGIHQPRIDNVEPPLGIVNETVDVTLHGEFPAVSDLVVTFGGVPAEITDLGDERIEVVAPASSVAGKVEVAVASASAGVHGSAPDAFEYYVPRLDPVITDVKPPTGPLAGGTLIEVTGRDFDPSAIVEVGGEEAMILARLGRTGLIVVAPANAGTETKDITVRQASFEDEPTAPHATSADAFRYVDEGAASETPDDSEVDGQWKVYGLGHWYLDEVDTTVLLDAPMTFAAGTFTMTSNAWFATPGDPDGTFAPMNASGPFRVFSDGTLWLKPSDEGFAGRMFLTDERDVFIIANDALTTGPVWLGAGIRRASGMSNASLAGTWHLALFSHTYAMGPDDRTISSAWGTAEFDGAGQGSAGLTGAMYEAVLDAEAWREPIGSALTYAVAADGTFTVTIPPPEEGGLPVVFHGSLTQNKDLAVAVSATEGEAQFLMMVPVATGFGPAYAFGSWYGGGLAYEHGDKAGNVFVGETIRQVSDGHGEGIGEVIVRVTSDGQQNGGMQTDLHEGTTLCETTGLLIGGPDDLSGFVGASRRFQIFLPANLEAYPDADAVEFMGASLLLRRPARYSSWTIDFTDYNAVGISTEYKEPGEPLSLYEENTSFRTTLSFSASASVSEDENSDLVGRVRENAEARVEKTVRRIATDEFSVDVRTNDNPEYRGPYAVFGDGRILISTSPVFDRLAASEEDIFEEAVGEITGNADVILLRNAVNPDGASAIIALARVASDAPLLDGRYHGGMLRFNYSPDAPFDWAEAGFGYMDLNSTSGRLSGTGTLWREQANGTDQLFADNWEDTPYTVDDNGFVSLAHSELMLTGIATPDGQAVFLVDLVSPPFGLGIAPPPDLSTTFLVGFKEPAAPVASAGSYRFEGLSHEYVLPGPLPVEAMKQVMSGSSRITNDFDAGGTADERRNTFEHVDRLATLYADNAFAVNPDGSISWNRPDSGSDIYRGWFSANGRYAFMMPTYDFGEFWGIGPNGISLYIAVR